MSGINSRTWEQKRVITICDEHPDGIHEVTLQELSSGDLMMSHERALAVIRQLRHRGFLRMDDAGRYHHYHNPHEEPRWAKERPYIGRYMGKLQYRALMESAKWSKARALRWAAEVVGDLTPIRRGIERAIAERESCRSGP